MNEPELSPFLRGNYAPWRVEGDAPALEVEGELPRDLEGTFYRNGPNPAYPPLGRYHWFDGDGMIHAITLRDGRASYRNRWVHSAGLAEERAAGKATFRGLLEMSPTEAPRFKNTANTNIVWHAGKLLALMEGALPTALQPGTLETAGEWDFAGQLGTAMTAHPKMDPETGEMLFFGYSPFPPYLTYHVADRSGALVRSEPIDLAWPSMIHDFAVTAEHVVFILCPLVFSFEKAQQRGSVFSWEPERGTRLGIMPRTGGNADVRWFETDASYVFHPLNAYDEGRTTVIDVVRYPRLDFMSPAGAQGTFAADTASKLHRWVVDRERGGVTSTPLDDTSCEFPRADERRLGRRHRYGYAAVETDRGERMPAWSAIRRYDLDRGGIETRTFGKGAGCGEPLFVPRRGGTAEDDGYVIVLVYDTERDASDFYVLDARNIAGEALARVRLPHRVPHGFHGNWVPA